MKQELTIKLLSALWLLTITGWLLSTPEAAQRLRWLSRWVYAGWTMLWIGMLSSLLACCNRLYNWLYQLTEKEINRLSNEFDDREKH